MTKETKSTIEAFVESLNPKELKRFNEEYKEHLISELLIAAVQKDEESVRELAVLAGLPPTIVQAMGSDLSMHDIIKILQGLGCKKLMVELNGKVIPVCIASSLKKQKIPNHSSC